MQIALRWSKFILFHILSRTFQQKEAKKMKTVQVRIFIFFVAVIRKCRMSYYKFSDGKDEHEDTLLIPESSRPVSALNLTKTVCF